MFQSSLLRCSYCDGIWNGWRFAQDVSFNPLYWGVLIVTVLPGIGDTLPDQGFNPLYWGVLIVTRANCEKPSGISISFQSSLLRCSYCDAAVCPGDGPRNVAAFQSSLLRCSYCDDGKQTGAFGVHEVSILFIEVFLLWRAHLESCSGWSRVSILFIEVFLLWRRWSGHRICQG